MLHSWLLTICIQLLKITLFTVISSYKVDSFILERFSMLQNAIIEKIFI